jgi:hypothetical protein
MRLDKTLLSTRREKLSFKPRKDEAKRYNFSVPSRMFDQVEAIAKKHKITTAETIRRCIALGIVVDQVSEEPGGAVLIQDKKGIREIELF